MIATAHSQSFRLTSAIESLAKVEELIDNICADYRISDEVYGNMLVTITEAVNNAINHGNGLDATKDVCIDFVPSEKELAFVISDSGNGFDYENIPDPTDPENLEKPFGRGIFIMKHLSDSLDFSNEGRTVKLSFNTTATLH